jgi:hypothetical protein
LGGALAKLLPGGKNPRDLGYLPVCMSEFVTSFDRHFERSAALLREIEQIPNTRNSGFSRCDGKHRTILDFY